MYAPSHPLTIGQSDIQDEGIAAGRCTYENAHRNTFIAFLLKHDGRQKSIKSSDFSDFRNVAQFERPFFVRTAKFNLHEINNLFIFSGSNKRQCSLFYKFRPVKAAYFTQDFHTQRASPLQACIFGITAGKLPQVPHGFPQNFSKVRWKSCRKLSNTATAVKAPHPLCRSERKKPHKSMHRTKNRKFPKNT